MENSSYNNSSDIKQNASFDEEESSFDFMKWILLILHYWYLFVLSVSIALVLAYLTNRKWTPTYKVAAKVIVEESNRGMGAASVMQGFDVQKGYQNINNQIIMFGSSDLISKAIDRLSLDVDYYTQGRFKTRNLYKSSPIIIEYDYLSDLAYASEFKITSLNDDSFKISFEGNQYAPAFSLKGKYDVPLQCSMFFITVKKSENFYEKIEMYFRFLSKETLTANFSSRLSFDFVMKGSSVVQVALVGKTVERDKDFINALCEEFLAENLARKNDEASKTIDFIDTQLLGIADSLSVAENNLRKFQTENKMLDMSSYSSNLIAQINLFDQKKVELNLKKTYLDYLSDYLKGNIQDGKIVAPSSLGVMDPMLMNYVKEFSDLQEKKDEMGVSSPYYKKYQAQIDAKKEGLFEVLRNMYEDFNIEKKDFENQYNQLLSKVAVLPDKESQMINYQRIYKIHDNYYTFLMQKRADAQIQKASNSPDNVILDKANLVNMINGGEKQKIYSQYLLMGMFLPLIFIILKELLNTTIRDKNEIKKYTNFDLIGTVYKGTSDIPALVLKSPKSLFTESFRLIRTRLEFVKKSKNNNSVSILVTSSQSGEGKSFFSVNLAGIFSMEKKKTILIDLDLRRPNIENSLLLKKHSGVSNYLIGDKSLEDIIIKDKRYPFDIILSGTIPPNPGELIKNENLKEMLDILKEKYDYIVIDTSPIGLVGDAYALTNLVDANLFLIRQNKTNKKFFKTVIDQIKEDKVPNVYLVLNDVQTKNNKNSGYLGYLKNSYFLLNEDGVYYEDLRS